MLVTHQFNKREISGNGSSSFLLASKTGNYLSLATEPNKQNISMYQGLFFPMVIGDNEWTMYKTIENIYPDKECTKIINDFHSIIRKYGDSEERLTLINNTFCYEINYYDGFINIDLDMRQVHNFDTRGRIHKIYKEGEYLIIEYTKYQDDSLITEEYTKYLAIKGVSEYQAIGKWERRDYSFDRQRNSSAEFYIYKALRIKCDSMLKLFISCDDSKRRAKNKATFAHEYHALLKNEKEKHTKNICDHHHDDENKFFAMNLSIKSINELYVDLLVRYRKSTGIYAGLPWFFQFWARDELISSIAFIKTNRYEEAKNLLFKYLASINEYGRVPNRLPSANLGSADGAGWLFKRIHEFLLELEKNRIADEHTTTEELKYIQQKLENAIISTKKHYLKDGLIHNDAKETWMDTDWDYDNREGCRIEIQALYLSMLHLINYLNKKLGIRNHNYEEEEKEFRENIKKNFFRNGILYDGLNDPTIRPNIFIAHYLYPELLNNTEWETVFKNSLKSLWLDWGGLSSIDKSHRLFCNDSTGITNQSYHRGDSWFFVNHIAAISMSKVNKKEFRLYIEKIIQASTKEILWMGLIGHNTEISSASELRSEGCLAQAWSAATFIELVKETG